MKIIPRSLRRSARLLKFCLVGTSGVVVNFGSYLALTRLLTVHEYIASPIAIEISIINNYVWNHLWTWGDRRPDSWKHWFTRLLQFALVSSLTAFGLQYVTFIFLIEVFQFDDRLAQLAGIAAGICFNFWINHFYVFKKKKTESDQPESEI